MTFHRGQTMQFRRLTYREADQLREIVRYAASSGTAIVPGFSRRLSAAHIAKATGKKHCRECGEQPEVGEQVIAFLFFPSADPATGINPETGGGVSPVQALLHLGPCPIERDE